MQRGIGQVMTVCLRLYKSCERRRGGNLTIYVKTVQDIAGPLGLTYYMLIAFLQGLLIKKILVTHHCRLVLVAVLIF